MNDTGKNAYTWISDSIRRPGADSPYLSCLPRRRSALRFTLLIGFIILIAGCGGGGGGDGGGGGGNPGEPSPVDCSSEADDPVIVQLEDLDHSAYPCGQSETQGSPWERAGLIDLGGGDSLSLIRRFRGCGNDPPYRGKLDIHVDIARIPVNAQGWGEDDGTRVDLSMEEAVSLLNKHVAPYYERISQRNLKITFRPGEEFRVGGDGTFNAMRYQQLAELGECKDLADCENYVSQNGPLVVRGLSRILLNDVASSTEGGGIINARWANLGLVSLRKGNMETIVHEIGHAWLGWDHSFTELPHKLLDSDELQRPDPYSNRYDVMSDLFAAPAWDSDMPSTLAINRYTAGWISPDDVALHTKNEAPYRLSKPRESGKQFLVVHSGRQYAFTTIEVLEDRTSRYKGDLVTDVSVPGGERCRRYEGVLVSRYDHSVGFQARLGPALYDTSNPNYLSDVGYGHDDYSVIQDGEKRDIGGGVSVSAKRNQDGSYEVTVSGGKVAGFEKWCEPHWRDQSYEAGCFLNQFFGTESS